jgi:hypothetical protein
LYWLLLSVFVDKNDPATSLFTHTLCAFFTLIAYSQLLFKKVKYTLILCIVYILKIIIGLSHYFYFVNPDYFSTPSLISMHYEYQVYFDTVCNFADAKGKLGLFGQPPNSIGVTHPELLNIISFAFYKAGNFILTIMPLNAMLSLFTALIITYSAQRFTNIPAQLKTILILCSLFPINLIVSLFQRDITGQFLMTLGVAAIVLSEKKWALFLSLLFASLLFYLQRTMYVMIPILAYMCSLFLFKESYKKNRQWLIFVLTIITLTVSFGFLAEIFEANKGYLSIFSNQYAVYLFPLKFIIGIIGPFPWTQFTLNVENSYQLQDYLMGVYLITILCYILPNFKKILQEKSNMKFMILIAFILILAGIMNPYMHASYVSIGSIFLIPVVSQLISLKKFVLIFVKICVVFILLNILYFAFDLTGSGFRMIFN